MNVDFFIAEISTYILVFCRIGGMIFFNPLLARKNLPSQFKVALVLGVTMLVAPTLPMKDVSAFTDLVFIWTMLLELLIGFACGYIFQLFYYLLFTAGDIVDMGFGLSMAKAFDPGSNVQISVSGNIFQLMFVMYILATNSHLVLIKLIVSSYDFVEMGTVAFGTNVTGFIFTLFSSVFLLAMQLALPFIAAAFVLEISMGILMKLIPQINVFVIHFQVKVMLGFSLLFMFAGPTSEFLIKYIDTMFRSMEALFRVM